MNVVLVVAVLLAIVGAMAMLSRNATSSRPSTRRHAGLAAAATVSIGLFAAQILAGFRSIAIQWLSPLREVVGVLDEVFSAGGGEVVSMNCLPIVASDTGRQVVSVAMLPLVILLALLVTAVRNCGKSLERFRIECVYTLGTVGLTFFISTVHAITKPFVAFSHFCAGRSSLVAYPNIFWSSAEHIHLMMLSAVVALAIPAPFVAACCWAVWQAPRRLARGDSSFFFSHRFLFGKYRLESHGYELVVLTRNFFVSMAPTIVRDNAAGQILLVMVVLAVHLSLLTKLQPWRVRRTNDLEAFTLILLQLVLAVGALLTEPTSMEVISIITMVILGTLSATIVAFLLAAAKWAMFASRPFAIFICKDEGAGRALSRALHLKLARRVCWPAKIFVSEDHFLSADEHFDVIRSSTRNFVVLLDRGTLYSPWCAAEITMAVENKVPVIAVRCPGFDPQKHVPSDLQAFLDFNTTGLAQHSIEPNDVLNAYSKVLDNVDITVDERLGNLELDALARRIADKATNVEQQEDAAPLQRRSPYPRGKFAVLSHSEDAEGSATALVIHELLTPHIGDCCFLQAQSSASPYTYEEVLKYISAPRLVEGACHGVVVLLSQAGLRLPEALGLMCAVARRRRLHDLGVVLVALPRFASPGEQFYQNELPSLLEPLRSSKGGDEELRFLLGLSQVHLDTHGSERMLRLQVEQIGSLLQSRGQERGEGSPDAPSDEPSGWPVADVEHDAMSNGLAGSLTDTSGVVNINI